MAGPDSSGMGSLDPRAIIAREKMHPRQVIAIAIATALNALDGFDVLSISFASPGISHDWGISRAALGVVLSMELIGMGFGALALGAMADRLGRRPTILTCLVVMTAGMLLAAFAHSVEALSAFRLLTGLGIGGMLASTNAIVAECSNARRRNLTVAIMAGGYPIGAIVGGFAATRLLGWTGHWQSVFGFGAALTFCFLPLVWFLVPETIAFLLHRRPPDALARVNRTMVRQGRAPLAALPPRETEARRASLSDMLEPGLPLLTALLTLAYFGHMMTFYFLVKWIPKIVVDLGFHSAQAGGVLVWTNVGGAAGSLTMSLLTQRFSVRRLVVGAMVCGAISVAAFGQGFDTLATLSLMGGIGGFFTNAATAGLYAILAQSYPARLRAGGTGLVIGIGRAGAASGPIVAGLLFAGGLKLPVVAGVLACGTLLGGIALSRARFREDRIA